MRLDVFFFSYFFRSVVKMFVCSESTVNHSLVHSGFCIHRGVSYATYFPFPHLFDSVCGLNFIVFFGPCERSSPLPAASIYIYFYFNLVKYYGYGLACFYFILCLPDSRASAS